MAYKKSIIERRDGSIAGVDWRGIQRMPFYLTTNPANVAVTVAANSVSPMTMMTVSGEGPAEIDSLAVQSTGAALVQMVIMDGTTPRALSNAALNIAAILGSGSQPYRLPERLYIDETRSIQVRFTDISGSSNTIRMVGRCGRQLEQQVENNLSVARKRLAERQYLSMPFWYTTDAGPITLTALGSATRTISIASDFHFDLYQLSVSSTGAFNLNITDATRGESIIDGFQASNFAISNGLFIGSNNFPFRLREPRFFQKDTKIQLDFTDLSNGSNVIYIALGGVILADRFWR